MIRDLGGIRLSSEAWRYLAVLASISIIAMYVEMVVMPSLPTIEKQYGVTESEVSWVLSSETLAGLALAPILGKLADSYGRKKVLLIVLIVYFIAVFFTSMAPTYPILIMLRAIQGIGLSINPIGYTLLREKLPPREWPVAQGIIASTFAIGAAVALPIGAYLAQYYSWQFAYETALPILAVLILMAYLVLPESEARVSESIDYIGLALLAISFVIIGYSFTEAPTWGWLSENFWLGIALGLAILFLFISHELLTQNPIINIGDFANPNIAVPLLSSFVAGFGMFLSFQALVYMFELPRPIGYGMTILRTGLTLAPIALIMLFAGPLYGILMNTIGYRRVLITTSGIAAIGGLLMATTVYVHELMITIVVMIISMIGIAGMTVTRITLLISSVSRDRMATMTGTNTAMRLMGNTLGPVIAGSLETTYRTPLLAYYLNGMPIFYEVPGKESFVLSFVISSITAFIVMIMSTKITR
ncbi:MFS transporter [Vulcanisaeta distributa]|uniref:Major facilitator superfamily MFS_1 n=1 Tax=Vulcanisaeta distributa (strain DSM 14429 / JCM 11212 / NBRC 100878 / IC-017) TaxID=572478 RepID=E1QTH1_VULDI|nr:MFS transporter [Vulcanisaeta distributa]ADN50964.1 major facilitator superfamily MFS_1 [Vulcanisaeta distributa DSM 14429]